GRTVGADAARGTGAPYALRQRQRVRRLRAVLPGGPLAVALPQPPRRRHRTQPARRERLNRRPTKTFPLLCVAWISLTLRRAHSTSPRPRIPCWVPAPPNSPGSTALPRPDPPPTTAEPAAPSTRGRRPPNRGQSPSPTPPRSPSPAAPTPRSFNAGNPPAAGATQAATTPTPP